MEGKQESAGVLADAVARSVMWRSVGTTSEQNGQMLNRHHITGMTTLERLCGRPHNRSVTISPRRYLDEKSGEWKDAGSLRPADIPSLILALEAAHEFVSTTPLPGQPADGYEVSNALVSEGGEVPF